MTNIPIQIKLILSTNLTFLPLYHYDDIIPSHKGIFKILMEYEFKYSKRTELEQIINSYANIAKGLYQKLGFLLVEELIAETNLPTCVIPSNDIVFSQSFIEELKQTKFHTGNISISKPLLNHFKSHFNKIELLSENEVEKIKKDWKKIEIKFFKILDIICSNNPYEKVVIIPTKYGVLGSYSTKGKTIFISIRIDQPVEHIASLILRTIVQKIFMAVETKDEVYMCEEGTWFLKEKLVDMLMLNTKLNELFPNYKSTLKLLERNNLDEKLFKKSNERYAKLGLPSTKSLSLNNSGNIELNGKLITNLSISQKLLLKNFLEKESQIFSNEDVAQILWGKNYYENLSLSAIMKMIHQLRQKLKSAGLQKEVLFTKRGKGYVLVQ